MKIPVQDHPRRGTRSHKQRALTLVEMMVTMFVFGLVIMGAVYTQQFGLQQDQLVQSKLGASFYARQGFDQLTTEIRESRAWSIGSGNATSFTSVATNATQTGNALQLYMSNNCPNYIVYYFDTNLQQLIRWQTDASGSAIIAQYLTNSMAFTAEDYLGNLATTKSYKNVIHVNLQFWQYQYPTTLVGSNSYYNFYQLQFKVTSHCPVWPT